MPFQVCLQKQSSPCCCGAQKRMAAAMAVGAALPRGGTADPCFLAESGQSIIFPQESDHRLPRSIFCQESRRHVGQPPGNPEPMPLQQPGHGFCRTELLEFQFRCVPDLFIQFRQFSFKGFQPFHKVPPFINNCCTMFVECRLFYFSLRASSSSSSLSRARS